MSENNKIIAVVDDHPIVIEGLKALFSTSSGDDILSFTTAADFRSFVEQHQVDAVLLDIALPDGNGVDLCKEIKRISPQTVVVGLSNQAEQSTILQLLQNGASGFLLKSAPASDILSGIDAAMRGEVVMSNDVRQIVFSVAATQRQLPSLTKREKQLLQLLAQGKTTIEIADELFLSRFTVDTYRKNLLQKFEVKNATELVTLLLQKNML
ncbi:response regulator transcription factor [Parapedobacter lycopersici]|uniref:response regulator transcription factor n=1 Tax=Parapedobacter lycopersici TaxID=1864939 RepID=UPI00214DC7C3|nr:response regulator transcription factor [Parapedobacter lycopersici]